MVSAKLHQIITKGIMEASLAQEIKIELELEQTVDQKQRKLISFNKNPRKRLNILIMVHQLKKKVPHAYLDKVQTSLRARN